MSRRGLAVTRLCRQAGKAGGVGLIPCFEHISFIIGGSCHKYYFCRDKVFVATNICRDKHNFVATKMILVATPDNDTPLSGKVGIGGLCLVTLPLATNETLKWFSSLPAHPHAPLSFKRNMKRLP